MTATIHHGDCLFHTCPIHRCVDPRYDCPSCPPPLDAGSCSNSPAQQRLHQKYQVHKVADPQGKHSGCRYFVLDLDHDGAAHTALRAYAKAIQAESPQFARELDEMAQESA